MLAWSNCSDVLAVGTVKGNMQLYFVKERRKMPVAAKHTKRVCAGSWALNENILALAAHDRTVSAACLTHARCSTFPASASSDTSTSTSSAWRSHLTATQCWMPRPPVQVTISNLSGDTLKTLEFKGDPVQLCAAARKDERPGSAKTKVGCMSALPAGSWCWLSHNKAGSHSLQLVDVSAA